MPALVKQADALVGGSSDLFNFAEDMTAVTSKSSSSKSSKSASEIQKALLAESAVDVVRTVGYLLHAPSAAGGGAAGSGWKAAPGQTPQSMPVSSLVNVSELCSANGSIGFHNSSREALPARVSQPLFRILARADITVGQAIIDTLCVICKSMGMAWVEYASRSGIAVVEWEARMKMESGGSKSLPQESQPMTKLYFDTVESMVQLQNIVATSKSDPSNFNFFSDASVASGINATFQAVDSLFASMEQTMNQTQTDGSMPQYGQQKLHVKIGRAHV